MALPTTTKAARIREALAAGDDLGALRIAAKVRVSDGQQSAIERGWAATQNPGFYRQLGRDPETLFVDAIAAIRVRYKV